VPLQQTCIEYRVSGSFDGVTPAPPLNLDTLPGNLGSPVEFPAIQLPPSSTQPDPIDVPADEEQIFVVDVENLGVLDLNFGFQAPGAFGNRYIPWLLLAAIPGSCQLSLARYASPGSPNLLQLQLLKSGAFFQSFISRGLVVPQGALLRVAGATAGPSPLILRLSLFFPKTREQEALIRKAFCCTANQPDADLILSISP
jgi:hypothetical protein